MCTNSRKISVLLMQPIHQQVIARVTTLPDVPKLADRGHPWSGKLPKAMPWRQAIHYYAYEKTAQITEDDRSCVDNGFSGYAILVQPPGKDQTAAKQVYQKHCRGI